MVYPLETERGEIFSDLTSFTHTVCTTSYGHTREEVKSSLGWEDLILAAGWTHLLASLTCLTFFVFETYCVVVF